MADSYAQYEQLSLEEFKTELFSLKKNKTAAYDDMDSNVLLNCYDEIKNSFYIFSRSLSTGIVTDALKIATITPIFRANDKSLLRNYRPISVLPIFSKMLERIMHNRIYIYLNNNN